MRIKTDAKRREILEAAGAEFSQRGFHGTTLDHVATRMGSSKATIYNYFPTKIDLFVATLAAAAQPATAALLEGLSGARSLRTGLQGFARAYVRMQASDRAVAIQRLIIAENWRIADLPSPIRDDPVFQIGSHLARFLEAAQARGTLREGSPAEMARHLGALLQGDLPMQLLFGEKLSATEAEMDASADSAVRMFLKAYGAQ